MLLPKPLEIRLIIESGSASHVDHGKPGRMSRSLHRKASVLLGDGDLTTVQEACSGAVEPFNQVT